MPTTYGDLIDRVLRHAPQGGAVARLTNSMSSGSQNALISFVVTDGDRWGAPVDVEIDSEIFHVTSFDRSTSTATAYRGWKDTAAVTHAADAVIRINPRFNRRDAGEAIVDCVRKIVPPLWRIKTTNLTFTSGTVGYSLPSDVLDVYRVMAQFNTSTNNWKELFSFEVAANMDTGDFANGIGLILREAGGPNMRMRVEYKAAFTDPTAEADDMESDVGLQAFMLDIPVWYAVSVLVPPDEVMRTGLASTVVSQRAEQVPPRANVTVAEYYRARYLDALKDAAERLQQVYPPRPRIIR